MSKLKDELEEGEREKEEEEKRKKEDKEAREAAGEYVDEENGIDDDVDEDEVNRDAYKSEEDVPTPAEVGKILIIVYIIINRVSSKVRNDWNFEELV